MNIYGVQLTELHTGLVIFSTQWHTTRQGAIDQAILINPKNKDLYEDNVVESFVIVD